MMTFDGLSMLQQIHWVYTMCVRRQSAACIELVKKTCKSPGIIGCDKMTGLNRILG